MHPSHFEKEGAMNTQNTSHGRTTGSLAVLNQLAAWNAGYDKFS
jgi:hypothetical protein